MNKHEIHNRLDRTYHKVIDLLAQAIASPQTALCKAYKVVAIEQTRARIFCLPTRDLDLLADTITTLKSEIS